MKFHKRDFAWLSVVLAVCTLWLLHASWLGSQIVLIEAMHQWAWEMHRAERWQQTEMRRPSLFIVESRAGERTEISPPSDTKTETSRRPFSLIGEPISLPPSESKAR